MTENIKARSLCAEAALLRQQPSQENLERAESLFRKAIQASPEFWMSHFGLGELLLFRAKELKISSGEILDEVIGELKRARELAPKQPEPPLKLAAYYASHDLGKARLYNSYAIGAVGLDNGYTMIIPEGLYPSSWQAEDYWEYAIGHDSETGNDLVAVVSFKYAMALNPDYAHRFQPSSHRALACWQKAKQEFASKPIKVKLPEKEEAQRQAEEQKRRQEEQARRQEETARRQVEEERKQKIIQDRTFRKECAMCGQPLAFFDKLRGRTIQVASNILCKRSSVV